MVLQLATSLGVPLRHINAMLRAAGHEAIYDEADDAVPASVVEALSLHKAHHEPFPLIVVDHTYRVRDLNRGAFRMIGAVLGVAATSTAGELNLARLTFDPDWRHVDFLVPSDPALVLHLRGPDLDLRFLTMVTAFQAPQNVAVEHLRIETWFPYDDATAEACRTLATDDPDAPPLR